MASFPGTRATAAARAVAAAGDEMYLQSTFELGQVVQLFLAILYVRT